MDRRKFKAGTDWQTLRSDFKWEIPQYFNIAQACCDDWAQS
ncbi:MAG: acetyl-CoA synthetase, partial [Paracoccaceae bacterium]